jgi:hypothetical protein
VAQRDLHVLHPRHPALRRRHRVWLNVERSGTLMIVVVICWEWDTGMVWKGQFADRSQTHVEVCWVIPTVCRILLCKSCVLPTCKKRCQVKKSSSPTVWHNPLAKSNSRETKLCFYPSTCWKLKSGIQRKNKILFIPPF